MARELALAVTMALLPVASIAEPVAAAGDTCTPWRSISHPPGTIRVFISHKRGSSLPAYVRTVPYREYVATVMASGAWPAHLPMESLKVGAIAIRQYAAWHIRHHVPGYSWKGRCYDIRNGDQLYRVGARVHSRIRSAIRSTWRVWLRKGDRIFRTGWRGNAGRDGWHLYEGTITPLAKRGWGWRRIVHQQLDPVDILFR